MEKINKIHVLELNNIDTIGHAFNGFNLVEYFSEHPENNIEAVQIVNHKIGHSKNVIPLFPPDLENFDYKIEALEKNLLLVKNQLSIAESALLEKEEYHNADILHFHMFHNMNLPISFLEHIPVNKKIIIDIHDTFWLTDKNIPMLEVFNFSDANKKSLNEQRKTVLKNIDAEFIVHSNFMLNLFKSSDATKHLQEHVHLIKFGINTNIFKPLNNIQQIKTKYHIPTNKTILFCRSQKEFKGIDYIIKALSLISKPQEYCIITIGAKNLLEELEQLQYEIIDFGNMSDEKQMVELFNVCDIFLSPSTLESFGFMAIEAMSCEKPVIVFDGTALPETTNAPAIGITLPRDSSLLAKEIIRLTNNKNERIKRGQLGRAYVLKNYNIDQYFTNHLNLYKKLSQKPQRNIKPFLNNIDTQNSNIKTLLHQIDPKTLEIEQLPSSILAIDYSDESTQSIIRSYNKSLYHSLKSRPITLKSIFKKITPNFIKKIIHKIRSKK